MADQAHQIRRARLMAIAAAAAISLAGACRAPADPVGLVVIDRETGEDAHVWRQDGREYIAGEPGHRYGLRVSNLTNGRVLVVLSVDGINVYDGETASYDQGGYVLSPYQSMVVKGWRKSTTEVAAFTFSPLSQSYAARTGRPLNVGVIGMAVFREFQPPPLPVAPTLSPAPSPSRARSFESPRGGLAPPPPLALPPAPPAPAAPAPPAPAASVIASRSGAAAPKAQALAEQTDEKLGTGHGEREQSVITLVSFVRATPYPASTRQIEYDTRAHLVASGIIPMRPTAPYPLRAFPSSPEPSFVPDPPGGS